MKKIRNNKGFTLVELLAVIVVLAIVMGLAVVGITSVLDNTRKSAFLADAKSFIAGAHSLVQGDEANKLLGDATDYAPDCYATNAADKTKIIDIDKIPLDGGQKVTEHKSPYGNLYSNTSKIQVSVDADCKLTYKIFLTDGVYKIGTAATDTGMIEESDLDVSDVKK